MRKFKYQITNFELSDYIAPAMSLSGQKLSNFFQYFGFKSKNYHLFENPANYRSDDILAYYLDFSKKANYEGEVDSNGIPIYKHKSGKSNHPVIASLYALGNLERFRMSGDSLGRRRFLKVAEWLSEIQNENGGWKSTVTMPKFGLRKEFYSGIIQGLAVSVLVRASILTNEAVFIESAIRALNLFQLDVKDGGIRKEIQGDVYFEEYPSNKNYHVLNGFIYSLWGLLDLIRYNDNAKAKELWESGLNTLVKILPKYDTGSWSLYHVGDGMKNPSTIAYHKIHIEQLKVMHEITGQKIFSEYSDKWKGYLHNRINAIKTLPQKILWNLAHGF